MAMSLRPISFQESSTTLEGLSTGFMGVSFLASWAWAGRAKNVAANNAAARNGVLLISDSSGSIWDGGILAGNLAGVNGMGRTHWIGITKRVGVDARVNSHISQGRRDAGPPNQSKTNGRWGWARQG